MHASVSSALRRLFSSSFASSSVGLSTSYPLSGGRSFLSATSFLILPKGSSSLTLDPRMAAFLCPTFGSSLAPLSGSRFSSSMASSKPAASVHDFTVKDASGNDVDLSTFKGKVLMIVNVASQCGLTNSNYTELSLYERYKDKVWREEPGTNEEIVQFACTRFKAEYPIFDKVDVNGEDAAPLYKFLKTSKGGLLGDGIKWNFSKFLVDKDGNVVDRYAPTTSPLSIEEDINKLLGLS